VLPSTSDIHRTELESVRLIVYHKFKRQGVAPQRRGVSMPSRILAAIELLKTL
jgi:hypothetical protein